MNASFKSLVIVRTSFPIIHTITSDIALGKRKGIPSHFALAAISHQPQSLKPNNVFASLQS